MSQVETQAPTQPKAPLRLTLARATATEEIQNQLKIGQAIRDQRVRDQRDLDEARLEKQEWVQRTTDLLTRLFTNTDVAEQFNNWVATILPEYAELGMFVELYDDEMKHRLGRLSAIAKALKDIPEPAPASAATTATSTEASAPAPASAPSISESATIDSILTRAIGASQVSPQLMRRERRSSLFAQGQSQAPATSATPNKEVPSVIARNPEVATAPTPRATMQTTGTGLLVIRNADDPARDAITQFVSKVGLTLQSLDRAASDSRSLVEVISTSPSVDFILLLTSPDAHQNLDGDSLFDLGCCVGKLGTQRVLVIHRGGDGATDRFGLAHVVVDGTDGWQLAMARHLRKGGVEVDLNKLI